MLGENIKKIRESKNMTQKELANKVNLSRKTILNYEQGVRHPRFDQMELIAKVLDVTLTDLIMVEGNVQLNNSELFMSKLIDEIEEHECDKHFHERQVQKERDNIRWKLDLLKEIERITGKEARTPDDDVNFYIPGEDEVPFDDEDFIL